MPEERGRLVGRPSIDAIWQGRRVRAVGNQIVFRPPTETRHEFFVFILVDTLGLKWLEGQRQRPKEEQHVISRWINAFDEMRGGGSAPIDKRQEGENAFSAVATGELLALACLAYDVYTLRHQMLVSPDHRIIKRLADPNEFQGARYELAVAAVFVRAGYALTWITATDRPLPEFIARNDETGLEIAVEAKSRHRPGTLGRSGAPPNLVELKGDVGNLLKRALLKETDNHPFVVCLDLNLPNDGQRSFEDWVSELHDEVLEQLGDPSPQNPDPFSAIFFTNYSWHWEGQRPAQVAESFVVLPRYARHPLTQEVVEVTARALLEYGDLPGGE